MDKYMDDETLALWKIWEQTDEDRAAIAQYFSDKEAWWAGVQRDRQIAETDTRNESAPIAIEIALDAEEPATARNLFPVWEASEPMGDALRIATARAHLEAA